MQSLKGKVALITGASRGVGKGIALELIEAGATCYITGRSVDDMRYVAGKGTAIECDHRKDERVESAFRRIADEQGRLDILVNNVWGGYENMLENGEFTWSRPFWQQPPGRWDAMFQAGVRAHYVASQMMVAQQGGLVVNLSFWAAQKHIGNVAYGVSKAATDKMTADMSHELREKKVAVVSLYPGLVRTESVLEAAAQGWLNLSNSESPEFIGRVVAGLAADPEVMQLSGQVVVAAAYALQHAIADVDGRQPVPITP